MQTVTRDIILAHCIQEYPLEACGLLIGDEHRVVRAFPARNEARSARVFVADPQDVVRARESATAQGLRVVGVYHSHTNSEAFPSPTDVAQAPDPSWWYIVVSLTRPLAELRCFTIDRAEVTEVVIGEAMTLTSGCQS
ncbi:MAG: M67 family metallopeptidase [Ferrimicrobium sp.]|uniref:M67 family metallopeptidase n=1 Tax=Ferrimicrobium sp. TaxID=2926050 RepID=UPI00261B7655|nr:M67 family metallopeptidase [Ferrimicrobium sp.]